MASCLKDAFVGSVVNYALPKGSELARLPLFPQGD